MKTLVCIYSEGNDTKVAVISKEKDSIKLLKVADFDIMQQKTADVGSFASLSLEGMTGDIALGESGGSESENLNVSNEGLLNTSLKGIKLNNCEFIPAITEPAIHYHIYEGSRERNSSKLAQDIVQEIQKTKNITVQKENLGYTELSGGSLLVAFADGEIGPVKLISSLATFNGRQRCYKIPSVKSADISLAYYVAKRKKFFPDDYSLIVYIGKEYSKLIFLQGKKLKHIGATLDVGTLNLHTYDVYFSKILLEMENGGIPRIDNVILCGEDDSENLILSFYGTFPEANVNKLDFEEIDTSNIPDEAKEKLSSYSVPVAVAFEYFDELSKEYTGINLLPDYVKEEQKFFQFGWHSLIILPLLFLVTLFLTRNIIVSTKEISRNTDTIVKLQQQQRENQMLLEDIGHIQGKISNFGATQSILDSASYGTEIWGKLIYKVSGFVGGRKSMWITSLQPEANNQIAATGYGLSRGVLTDFTASTQSGILKSVVIEPIRDRNVFKFTLNFDLINISGKSE